MSHLLLAADQCNIKTQQQVYSFLDEIWRAISLQPSASEPPLTELKTFKRAQRILESPITSISPPLILRCWVALIRWTIVVEGPYSIY